MLATTDSAAKRAAIARAFDAWAKGDVEVRVVPNRGRNIGPKLIACAGLYAGHDLVLFLHSKRDSHFADGAGWRRCLLRTIAGSILEVFRRDSRP